MPILPRLLFVIFLGHSLYAFAIEAGECGREHLRRTTEAAVLREETVESVKYFASAELEPDMKIMLLAATLRRDRYLRERISSAQTERLAATLLNPENRGVDVRGLIEESLSAPQMRRPRSSITRVAMRPSTMTVPSLLSLDDRHFALDAKLNEFLDLDCRDVAPVERQPIKSFILHSVLRDPQFKSDPILFLQTWLRRTPPSAPANRAFRVAQDFLSLLARFNQLAAAAEWARSAPPSAGEHGEYISDGWRQADLTRIRRGFDAFYAREPAVDGCDSVSEGNKTFAYLAQTIFIDEDFKSNPLTFVDSLAQPDRLAPSERRTAWRFLRSLRDNGRLMSFASLVRAKAQ